MVEVAFAALKRLSDRYMNMQEYRDKDHVGKRRLVYLGILFGMDDVG